jgi:N4-gp56 family major capsid protein
MAQQTWTVDAPTGVYKNHALSSRLYEASLEDTKFVEFTRPVEGYGRKMGESITLTRVANITEPTSAVLSEGVRIPEDTFSLSTVAITPQELGRAVPYTSLSEDLSKYDIANPIQRKLRSQLSLVLDTLASNAFQGCQIKYIPTGALSGTFDTDGTASTAATSNMNVYHVERIVDYLYDDLQCAPYEGGDYVGIFRTLGIRGIMSDPAWEDWHRYTDPQAKFNGEVGRMESCRFVKTNHANALGEVGTSSVLGEGVVFGEDPVVMAEVLAPELRLGRQDEDFGRAKSVAWYANLGFDEVWNTANAGQARIIHVTSS